VHSSIRDERKQRRELLLGKASRAGRQEELPIIVDGAEVRARHSTHRLLRSAVASAYGLLIESIALDSILLAFGNAFILLLILFILFGWRELLGEFTKKRSTAN
jgi:hypothetical protein